VDCRRRSARTGLIAVASERRWWLCPGRMSADEERGDERREEPAKPRIRACRGDCLPSLSHSHVDGLDNPQLFSRMSERLLRLRERFSPAASTDAFHSTHLRIGDVCSLFALDPYNGNKHEG